MEEWYQDYVDWYNTPSGTWAVDSIENKWYAVENTDGTITINLKDASGNVVDTYQLNTKTGIGEDANGGEVNLPQTGNNALGTVATAVSGLLLTLMGALAVLKSGFSFRKRR